MRAVSVAQTEAGFQAQISHLARICGWQSMHVRHSIGKGRRWTTATSVVGWPDLALWRPGRFLLVELKTDTGRVSEAQAEVIASLQAAGVDARIWRPQDWPEIEATLTRKDPR